MKVIFLAVLVAALACVVIGARPQVLSRPAHHPMDANRYTGNVDRRSGMGRHSTVNYDGTHVDGLITLDYDTTVSSVECVSADTIRVSFSVASLPSTWIVGAAVVGSRSWGCIDATGAPKNVFVVITGIAAPQPGDQTYVVSVRPATIQDVFTDLTVTVDHNMWEDQLVSQTTRQTKGLFSHISHAMHDIWHGVTHVISDVEHGVKDVVHDVGDVISTIADAVKDGGININKNIYNHVFGVNYDAGSSRAARSITLISGADGSVTCDNCYAYLDVTAHVDLRASLTHFSTEVTLSGTGNVHIGASLDMHAALSRQMSASLGSLSYNIPLSIGVVPLDIAVSVGLQGIVNVQVDASVSSTLTADLTGSVVVGAAYGSRPSDYSQWRGDGPWYTLATDSFKPSASIGSHITASGDVKLTLQPTLSLSIDGLGGPNFVLSPYVEPTINLNAQQSGRTLSGSADLRVYGGLSASVDVAFHIPLLGSKTFGPYSLYSHQWLLYQHSYPFSRTLALPEPAAPAVSRRLLQNADAPVTSPSSIVEIDVPKQTQCAAQCTLATSLSVCASSNNAYVCVPQEEIAAREAAVAETVRSLVLSGPACAQRLLPFLCELYLPRCDSGDRQTLLPLCFDSCSAALSNCGVSRGNISQHCGTMANVAVSPLAGAGQPCVRRDTDTHTTGPRDRPGQCVSAQGLRTCSSHTGYVHVSDAVIRTGAGESAAQLALDLDDMIAQRAAAHTARTRANYILHTCNQFLPACSLSAAATSVAVAADGMIAAVAPEVATEAGYQLLPMCQSGCIASFFTAGVPYAAGVCSHTDAPTIGNYIALDDSNCAGAVSLTSVFPPLGSVISLPTYGFGLLVAALTLCALAATLLCVRSVALSRRLSAASSVKASEQGIPLVSAMQA